MVKPRISGCAIRRQVGPHVVMAWAHAAGSAAAVAGAAAEGDAWPTSGARMSQYISPPPVWTRYPEHTATGTPACHRRLIHVRAAPAPWRHAGMAAPGTEIAMHTRRALLLLSATTLAARFGASAAPAAPGDGWKASGDLRGGWFASEGTARDGTESSQDAFNARLRVAIERGFADHWTVRTRVAGRFSSDQDGTDVYLRSYAPTRSGARFGDVTLDEAYLGYQAPDNGLRLRVGRFQTAFAVPGVASKGLDRNDSPNIDVQWTDGVHLDVPVAGGWRGHAIAQYRDRKGSGGVAHAPLDFSDDGSRATVFLGLENKQRLGPITQRMVSVTWMPDSLADRRLANPSRTDYMAAAARGRPAPGGGRGSRLCAEDPAGVRRGHRRQRGCRRPGLAAAGEPLRLRAQAPYRDRYRRRRRGLAVVARLSPERPLRRDPLPVAVPAEDLDGSALPRTQRARASRRHPRSRGPRRVRPDHPQVLTRP